LLGAGDHLSDYRNGCPDCLNRSGLNERFQLILESLFRQRWAIKFRHTISIVQNMPQRRRRCRRGPRLRLAAEEIQGAG
jgi:hypothetical protein